MTDMEKWSFCIKVKLNKNTAVFGNGSANIDKQNNYSDLIGIKHKFIASVSIDGIKLRMTNYISTIFVMIIMVYNWDNNYEKRV